MEQKKTETQQITMNNINPKISVIVCILEIDGSVVNCLKSIAAQTYSDYEVVVVFKSNQNSKQVNDALCKVFGTERQILTVEQFTGKLSDARNLGIDAASGDFITFVDGDDYVKPEHLWDLIKDIDNSIDAVMSIPELCGSFTDAERKYFNALTPGIHLINEKFILKVPVVIWGKLFRKSIIKNSGIRLPSDVIFEDNYFHWAYLSLSRKVKIIDRNTYIHVARTNSLMGLMKTECGREGIDNIKILGHIIEFLQQKGREDLISYRLLRKYYLDGRKFTNENFLPELNTQFCAVIETVSRKTGNLTIIKLAKLGYPIKFSTLQLSKMIFTGMFARLRFTGK